MGKRFVLMYQEALNPETIQRVSGDIPLALADGTSANARASFGVCV